MGIPPLARGKDHRKIEQIVRGLQLNKEIEDLVHGPVRPRRRLVNLIDDHQHRKRNSQGFFQNKIGLGHRTFLGIHQEQTAVRHAQDPLNLATKIRMARRVDDIDQVLPISKGSVLGSYGDTALPFQVHGVHKPLGYGLVIAKHAALLKELVNKGGLPMIDMGYNRYISNQLLIHNLISSQNFL